MCSPRPWHSEQGNSLPFSTTYPFPLQAEQTILCSNLYIPSERLEGGCPRRTLKSVFAVNINTFMLK